MGTLTALVLATPIFGFSLAPPDVAPLAGDGILAVPAFAEVDSDGGGGSDGGSSRSSSNDLGAQLRQRQEIANVHRAFGIATWASMLVTVAIGFIQYYNLYGFRGDSSLTPCVQGEAWISQDMCWDTPWAHRISALTTTALYATTFILSFTMPDPLGASEGDTGLAPKLRIHEALRWVHLGGMIAQILLGFAVGQNWFGLDRANDYDAQHALAITHQVIGWTTFGVLTGAAAIMIF